MIKLLIFVSILLISSDVFAEDPYSFGGACPSHGSWTRMAAENAEMITHTVEKLQSDPNCAELYNAVVGKNESWNEEIGGSGGDPSIDDRNQKSYGHTQDMYTYSHELMNEYVTDGRIPQDVANTFMKKLFRNASSNLHDGAIPANPESTDPSLSNLLGSYAKPVKKGLDRLHGVIGLLGDASEAMPKTDRCLTDHPNEASTLLGGLVGMTATFGASNQATGSTLGTTIATFAKALRDRKFSQAIRKNERMKFWNSISCLIDTTTKAYCDIQQAQELMEYARTTREKYEDASEAAKANIGNPMAGYYLMVREVPMISAWVQRVLLGFEPHLYTDGQFKDNILDDVNDALKLRNDLIATYFHKAKNLEQVAGVNSGKDPADDIKDKRSQVLAMVKDLILDMSAHEPKSGRIYFFKNVEAPEYLPFYLIGLKEVPQACRSDEKNLNPKEWAKWMQTGGPGGGYVSAFDDPDALVTIIHARLKSLVDRAISKVGDYYRRWIVVDLVNLEGEAVVGPTLSVYEAINNTIRYLEGLKARVAAANPETEEERDENRIIYVEINETLAKLNDIRAKFKPMADLGKIAMDVDQRLEAIKKIGFSDPDQPQKQAQIENEAAEVLKGAKGAADILMSGVFEDLMVVLQRETLLSSRLTTIITKDFSMRIRAKDQEVKNTNQSSSKLSSSMSDYTSDIMNIAQNQILDLVLQAHQRDPALATQDLATASVTVRQGLQTISEIFRDELWLMILKMKAMVEVWPEQKVRDMRRGKNWSQNFNAYWGMPMPGVGTLRENESHIRAPHFQDGIEDILTGGDDKYHSAATLLGKYCALGLSLVDRGFFQDLCQGVVLKSYYDKTDPELSFIFDRFLPSNDEFKHPTDPLLQKELGVSGGRIAEKDSKAEESYGSNAAWKAVHDAEWESRTTCAYQRFQMRSMVKWLKDQESRASAKH